MVTGITTKFGLTIFEWKQKAVLDEDDKSGETCHLDVPLRAAGLAGHQRQDAGQVDGVGSGRVRAHIRLLFTLVPSLFLLTAGPADHGAGGGALLLLLLPFV